MDFVILTRKPLPIRLVRHTIPWDLDLNGELLIHFGRKADVGSALHNRDLDVIIEDSGGARAAGVGQGP
jgi:hypothetical protein